MPERRKTLGLASAPLRVALSILTSFTLAVSLFAAGFSVCTLRPTTGLLSRMFSDFDKSAYLPDDTVSLAQATRDFTVIPHKENPLHAAELLAAQILDAAERASDASSIKADRWSGTSLHSRTQGSTGESALHGPSYEDIDTNEGTQTLAIDPRASEQNAEAAPSTEAEEGRFAFLRQGAGGDLAALYALAEQKGSAYAFGEDELSHLEDCNLAINRAIPLLIVIAVLALLCCMALVHLSGVQSLGRALIAGPAVLLAALFAVGIWALVDFSGFFAAFHGLFFPQGNWTFPSDSLLICMLPTPFWIGMLFVWILVTVCLSLLALALGRILAKRS